MLHWLIQTIAENIVALGLGMAIGYGIHWHRSRLKVSLATHIEHSWSDRTIHMSIMNHGNRPITVDSWTVHTPLEELLPGVAERDDKTEAPRPNRLGGIRRPLGKANLTAMANELSGAFARSMLNDPHFRHQLLDPGNNRRIEPEESAVRSFPRTRTVPQAQTIVSKSHHLTIIPSCHVIGRRRRIWGSPSILGGGPIPIVAQFNPPRIHDED
jgi:hypothetical protein